MGSLNFRYEDLGANSVHVIILEGELDAYSSPRLRELLTALIDGGSTWIVIDCSLLNYVDSSGLGALVAGLKHISDNAGMLALAQANDDVRRVLQVTGLDRLIPMYRDVEEAREARLLQTA
jgi:anti-sigma B factor antagonist